MDDEFCTVVRKIVYRDLLPGNAVITSECITLRLKFV